MTTKLIAFFAFVMFVSHCLLAAERPNILWLTSEDHGPEMGCYGDILARTPNVDGIAAKGMAFRRAWSIAPVCAPARTAIITGLYPSSSGGLHMRSMVKLPASIKLYPQYLRESGYYCTNNSKTDYNVNEPGKVWDESSGKANWKNRAEGQPFFAVFNSTKSHESQIRTRPHTRITNPSDVRVPGYHPDLPEVREDWAQYYDKVSEADADAGKRLAELSAAGLAEDTVVFYYGDHGSGMPRSKRWPSNSGLHVPMVVYFPPKWEHLAPKEYKSGGTSDRMVSFVDLAPTVLSIAGIKPPEWMQGFAFAGPYQSEPQPFLYGERGRMDERMDLVRSVTDGRYVYLRNYYPHVSQAQRVAYQFETPSTQVWFQQYTQGRTNEAQSIFWKTPKASEELYDLVSDRDEVKNLANSKDHQAVLQKMRDALTKHMTQVKDVCFLPEMEMHSRSAGSTPYETARDSNKYSQVTIMAAAETASKLESTPANSVAALISNGDSAVRYWGAIGLLARGKEAISVHEEILLNSLADASPSVRIVAAQALALHGSKIAQDRSLETLGAMASPEKNGVLVSMSALAAIEAIGEKGRVLHPMVETLKPDGPSPHSRYDSYVPRLIKNIAPKASVKP